jgi:hypothetical protein
VEMEAEEKRWCTQDKTILRSRLKACNNLWSMAFLIS